LKWKEARNTGKNDPEEGGKPIRSRILDRTVKTIGIKHQKITLRLPIWNLVKV
jgi:hypothetical protein